MGPRIPMRFLVQKIYRTIWNRTSVWAENRDNFTTKSNIFGTKKLTASIYSEIILPICIHAIQGPTALLKLIFKDTFFIYTDQRFAIENFLEIMKNRQNRKLRKSWHQKTQMSQFKHCVKNILRENSHHHGILG